MKSERRKSRRWKTWASVAAVVVALALPVRAAAEDVDKAANDAGLGLATIVANVFYIPVKVSYAAIGGITGGLGYVLTGGNEEVAKKVWVPSIGGDYVLTREMVAGQQPIEFKGRSDPDM
ncbi:MAG: hypothetical protein D6815_10330 [Candidatus Dadabacteria bacterium]|nr:MAG: hypothetical protein D6815_10330 [Candidatus Dadabacteria bacterium]